MTADTPVPQPQECWGLFDASGIEKERSYSVEPPGLWYTLKARANDGWSIHRVRVEPVGVK